jgi:hypothetical protein
MLQRLWYSTMKMYVAGFTELFVWIYQATRCHILYHNHHHHHASLFPCEFNFCRFTFAAFCVNGSREQKQYSGPMRHNDNICSGKRRHLDTKMYSHLAYVGILRSYPWDTSSIPLASPYVNTRQTLWHTTWSSRYSLNTGTVGGTQQIWPQQFLRRSRNEPEMYEDDVECPRTLRYHVQRVL